MKKVRESNFELLRCVLMFMVVLVHYNNEGMGNAFSFVEKGTINYYFLCFIESLAIIGTNGFVLLTGYFSWKKNKASLRKPLGLLLYVVSYNVLFYYLNILILHEPFSLREFVFSFVPRNWYIILYIVLMCLCPYINIVINALNKKSYFSLLTVMFLLFSVWPTILEIVANKLGISIEGMHTIALSGSSSGYNIVNFILLYLIGAAISKFNLFNKVIWWDIIAYFLCSIVICVQQLTIGSGWSYANPAVIISCVCFFNIFRKIHLKSRFINKLSKASLGVFLIHTQYMVCNYIWSKCNIVDACLGNIFGLAIHILLLCGITYLLCSVIDTCCRWVARPVSNMLDRISILQKDIIFIDKE